MKKSHPLHYIILRNQVFIHKTLNFFLPFIFSLHEYKNKMDQLPNNMVNTIILVQKNLGEYFKIWLKKRLLFVCVQHDMGNKIRHRQIGLYEINKLLNNKNDQSTEISLHKMKKVYFPYFAKWKYIFSHNLSYKRLINKI